MQTRSHKVSWHTCYKLVKVLSRNFFAAWVVFVEAKFSCLNIKPDDGPLPYIMLEAFNKSGHGLIDIIIA